MAEAYGVLGQANPSATTLTDLITVPSATSMVVSTIMVCNRGAAGTTFRIAVAPGGAADDPKHYLFYDTAIAANDSKPVTIGVTLAATDKVRVYATLATLAFSAFGVKIT